MLPRWCPRVQDIFGPKFGERYVRVSIQEDTTPADLQSLEGAPKACGGKAAVPCRGARSMADGAARAGHCWWAANHLRGGC